MHCIETYILLGSEVKILYTIGFVRCLDNEGCLDNRGSEEEL